MYRASPGPSPFLLTAVDGTVTAHVRATGAIAWTFRVPDGTVTFHLVTRLAVEQERVVIAAGRVDERGIFASSDSTTHLCCLDHATGQLLWHQRVKTGQGIAQFTATLLVDGGQIFLAHNAVLSVFALENGAPLWWRALEEATFPGGNNSVALAVMGRSEQGDAR